MEKARARRDKEKENASALATAIPSRRKARLGCITHCVTATLMDRTLRHERHARKIPCAGDTVDPEYRVAVSSHNVLAFSDVHLGSDLVSYAIPDAPERTRVSIARDRDLSALLDWYRTH